LINAQSTKVLRGLLHKIIGQQHSLDLTGSCHHFWLRKVALYWRHLRFWRQGFRLPFRHKKRNTSWMGQTSCNS
jgi:hypothetical protein